MWTFWRGGEADNVDDEEAEGLRLLDGVGNMPAEDEQLELEEEMDVQIDWSLQLNITIAKACCSRSAGRSALLVTLRAA